MNHQAQLDYIVGIFFYIIRTLIIDMFKKELSQCFPIYSISLELLYTGLHKVFVRYPRSQLTYQTDRQTQTCTPIIVQARTL